MSGAAPGTGLPGRLRLVVALAMTGGLALSGFLYALLKAFGWPGPQDDVLADLAITFSPALLAVVSGILAHRVWRGGRHRLAVALVVLAGAPVLAALLLWLGSFA